MEESTFRRRSNRDSANFHAGYVPVDETYLPQTGIRGAKSCCLYTVLTFMTIIALLNAAVTVAFVYFMNITHHGLESAEFLTSSQLLRVLPDIQLTNIDLYGGMLGGRRESDVEIMGQSVSLNSSTGESVTVNAKGILMRAEEFQVNKNSSQVLFSIHGQPRLFYKITTNSKMGEMQTNTIYNRTGVKDLHVESYHDLQIVGMEGISMQSDGNVSVHAEGDAEVTSLSGRVTVESIKGTFFHSGLPLSSPGQTSVGSVYKVCVCMPGGRVFVVQITGKDSGCHKASETENPCKN